MVFLRRSGVLVLFSFLLLKGNAQVFQPAQAKLFRIVSDTLVLDSLSLVPGTVQFDVFPGGSAEFQPTVDYRNHALVFKRRPDSILVRYRRYPYNFEKSFFHKDVSSLYTDMTRPGNPFTIRYEQKQENLFVNDGLNKNGNISRGISFGNNQDVVVNSNLNLQVSGKLSPEIDLVMAATDNNIPFQADGTTAQLQEFDKVFIQLSNYNTRMIVGDYQLSRPQNSYFMNFYKRAQGIYLENAWHDSSAKKPLIFRTRVSGAVSRGKFARQVFFGTENNQGPYRLRGADNEPFIIVLSGTEKIYIDGKLLQRGQENDYIIDYNTGELSFTAKQLITKDKRIVAEFQYAERNYARSLFFFGEEIESGKSRLFLNFFSEQDNRNRPLLQTLVQEQKNAMAAIGDTLEKAYSSGVQAESFNNSDVFYRRTDTVVGNMLYPGIFIYSQDAEQARYRIRFSNVGQGRGNYRQVNAAANGKVYEWVAPVDGIPQGTYDTVIPLVTPKRHQMLSAGFSHSLSADNTILVEGVYTKNDINQFSRSDKGNDEGSGVKVQSRNQDVLAVDSLKNETRLVYNLSYEFLQRQFTQVERFRSIEFERDWNRPLNTLLRNDQHLAAAELGILKTSRGSATYGLNIFNEGNTYQGVKHLVGANYLNNGFDAAFNGSFLETKDRPVSQNTRFYRHKTLVSKKLGGLKLAYSDEFENNIFRDAALGRLLPRAYQFWEWEGSLSNADSSKNKAKIFYRERRDRLAYGDVLSDSTFATNIGVQASVYSIKNNPFSVLVTYRKLELKNVVGNFLKPDNTLLNRLEYNPRYFGGFLTAGVFYEAGYGLENKREFYYLEVAPGQGQYAWNDYNGNDIKELSEFETARFADQARYIRIYTPTNDYVKVLQNQVSLSLSLRPAALLRRSPKVWAAFVNRWSAQTALRLDNKVSDQQGVQRYNPFAAVADSLLLGSNNNFRQSIFFNQSSPVFGADYTYIDNASRQLLLNGIEERTLLTHQVKWRLNFLKAWAVNSDNLYSEKSNTSRFFSSRNYLITSYESEQKLVYQPNTVFRISAIYKYNEKVNRKTEGGLQQAFLNTYGLELKYNQTEKGSLTGRLDYIQILFNDDENSPVAFEMLNGLRTGNNFTWELNYQRNLNSNIQVSINYNGRKTPGTGAVHLGGAQVRAFF